MLALIAPLLTRGIIDNTRRGCTLLQLQGIDKGELIELALKGDCLRDIAGCRVSWDNQEPTHEVPTKGEHPILQMLRHPSQEPLMGDITLSARRRDAAPPHHLHNLLSIEFFLGTQYRVLIELTRFRCDISLPQWTMSWEDETAQSFCNAEALRAHVAHSTEQFASPAMEDIRLGDFPSCDWDLHLNRAEARMAIYPSVHEKYRGRPDARLCEAYVMEREDLLAAYAAEDEAHLPPTPDSGRLAELADFTEPEHREAMRSAMNHPIFRTLSELTVLVRRRLPDSVLSPATEDYIRNYSAVVSHLLATLLLTNQEKFPRKLAQKRLKLLAERVRRLVAPSEYVPFSPESRRDLRAVAGDLPQRIADLAAQLRP